MFDRKTWEEFKDSGMLWLINTILHVFGWAITYEIDNGEIVDVFPRRVKYRGFSEEANTDGYIKVTEYMKNNCEFLLKEAKDEDH